MNIKYPISIKGIGRFLPETIISNKQIEQEIGVSPAWITKHVGVENRHRAVGHTCTSMAKMALDEALKDARIDIAQLDCLIGASATFDHIIPNRSSLLKHQYTETRGLGFPCVDINTVCTSFVSALHHAALLLQAEEMKHIAIVSSEISSNGLDPNNHETYSLFGDGAAAVIVSKAENNNGISAQLSETYANHTMDTFIQGGGNAYHPKHHAFDPQLHSFQMRGNSLLKAALSTMPDFLNSLCEQAETDISSIDCIVPHQTSKNGMRVLRYMNNCQDQNIINNLSEQGNCIAASIPLALYSAIKNNKLKPGDSCLLLGTAAGLTLSGIILSYSDE